MHILFVILLGFLALMMVLAIVGSYFGQKEYQAKQAAKQREEDRKHKELLEALKKERDE